MNTFNTRKNLLAAAAALTVLTPSVGFAQVPGVTIYGRVDLAAESGNNGATNRLAVQNFASRLGFRGERDFGGITGLFQIETGVAPDDTTQSKTFASRNSFVGVKSATAGQLIFGTNDMPLKALEGTAYGLWGEGDLQELIIHGKGSRTAIGNSAFANVHTRKTNVLHYTSPKFANMTAKLAFSPDENKSVADASNPAFNKSVFGASLEYNDGMFNVGVATEQQKQFNGTAAVAAVAASATRLAVNAVAANAGTTMKGLKLTGGVNFGVGTVGVAYSKLDNGNGAETKNAIITGTYALTSATTLKASFGRSSKSGLANKADGLSAAAVEADYAVDKQFTVYGYFAKISNGADAKASFAAADNFPAASAAGKDPRALGVGIRYNF